MTIDAAHVLHQTLFGGLAAAGFGVLFNIAPRSLPAAAAAGAVALMVRTLCQEFGLNLESASFVAALAVGFGAHFVHVRTGMARSTLAVAGCIPMVPGGFTIKAIMALYALNTPGLEVTTDMVATATLYVVRATLTVGALGAGLAIPLELLRGRDLRDVR